MAGIIGGIIAALLVAIAIVALILLILYVKRYSPHAHYNTSCVYLLFLAGAPPSLANLPSHLQIE